MQLNEPLYSLEAKNFKHMEMIEDALREARHGRAVPGTGSHSAFN